MRRVLVLSLVVVLTLLVAGCGGTIGPTAPSTAAVANPPTTTTQAPTTTTAGSTTTNQATTSTTQATTTTAEPTTTTLSVEAELMRYAAELIAWGERFETLPEPGPSPDDVSKLTDADVEEHKVFTALLHGVVDDLNAIRAPAAVAAAHQKLVTALAALVAVADKALTAEENRDQAAYDAAEVELEEAMTTVETAMEEWQTALQDVMSTP